MKTLFKLLLITIAVVIVSHFLIGCKSTKSNQTSATTSIDSVQYYRALLERDSAIENTYRLRNRLETIERENEMLLQEVLNIADSSKPVEYFKRTSGRAWFGFHYQGEVLDYEFYLPPVEVIPCMS